MKKMKKSFALMTGAAISLGMMSGVRVEAATTGIFTDFMGMTSLNDIPEGCEELRNTEIYNNHQAYFVELGPYAYRSKEYPTIFYGFGLHFNRIELDVDNDDGQWREIYDKYNDKLNFGEPYIDHKVVNGDFDNLVVTGAKFGDTLSTDRGECSNWNGVGLNGEGLDFSADTDFSDIEAQAQEFYDSIPEKYPIIMEMIAEMKEASCINGATYTPFEANADSIWTRDIRIQGYKGTSEELESLIRSKVSGNPDIECGTNDSGESGACIIFMNLEPEIDDSERLKTGGTAEDFFALYEMFKGMEKEMGLSVTMYHSLRDPKDAGGSPVIEDISMSSKSIDCFAVLDSAGDVNIDGRLGIQDIIAVNKNISEIITFNYEQAMAADMNYDGTIDIDDLVILMHKIID